MIDYRSGLMILGDKMDRKTDNVGTRLHVLRLLILVYCGQVKSILITHLTFYFCPDQHADLPSICIDQFILANTDHAVLLVKPGVVWLQLMQKGTLKTITDQKCFLLVCVVQAEVVLINRPHWPLQHVLLFYIRTPLKHYLQ